MPFSTYILQSEKSGKLYIGQSSNVEDRLNRHNSGQSLSTKGKSPWRLIYIRAFETRSEAVLLEKKLKCFKNKEKVLKWIIRHSG